MKKIWIRIAIILLVAGIGASFFFLSQLNSIVARVIEKQGGLVTATKVDVAGVDISLREGRGTIAGLSVANPDGFAAREAFTLGEITVDIDLGSVGKDPLVITEIRVRTPVVNAEILKTGSANLDVLRKNAQSYAGAEGNGGGENQDESKRIRIKRFVFEEGRIEVDLTDLGQETRSLDLPSVSLEDLGGAEGARPDEIARAVLDALCRKAAAEIARTEINQKVKDQARGLLDKLGK